MLRRAIDSPRPQLLLPPTVAYGAKGDWLPPTVAPHPLLLPHQPPGAPPSRCAHLAPLQLI